MEYAPQVFHTLNGIFCIYKPSGQTMKAVISALQVKLSNELNAMKTRPVRQRLVLNENYAGSDLPVATTVPDLADHPLVLGPRYMPQDFDVGFVCRLSGISSGVIVMSIGEGRKYLRHIARARFIRTHHLKGQLGRATQDFRPEGRLVEKTTFDHVTHAKIDKVIAAMQAGHQKHMFMAAKVNQQSQEAYEIAAQGLMRPSNKDAGPVVYGMKCIHFAPPDFTIEIHSINEDCNQLASLIHHLGLELKSGAVCTQVRRIRYGPFTLAHALLHKHWSAQSIIENIDFCKPLVTGQMLYDNRESKQVEQWTTPSTESITYDEVD